MFGPVLAEHRLEKAFIKKFVVKMAPAPGLWGTSNLHQPIQAWPDLWASEKRVKAALGGPVQSRLCPVTGQTLVVVVLGNLLLCLNCYVSGHSELSFLLLVC